MDGNALADALAAGDMEKAALLLVLGAMRVAAREAASRGTSMPSSMASTLGPSPQRLSRRSERPVSCRLPT
jgi:hypothetical protein